MDFNQIPKQEKESLVLSELALHRADLIQSLTTEERAIPLHSHLLNPGTWWKLFLTCLGLGSQWKHPYAINRIRFPQSLGRNANETVLFGLVDV